MKLDMEMIGQLAPSGLLEVWGLMGLVRHLIAGIDVNTPSNGVSLKAAQLIGRLLRQLRESEAYNLNLRIRMWVLQSAARRAWVRDMIGEQAISRWHKRYNMLSTTNSGLGTPPSISKPTSRMNNKGNTHPYRHRQFALPRLAVRSFDPLWARAKSNAVYFNIQYINPIKLYSIPPQTPAIFWPHELCPNHLDNAQNNMSDEAKAAHVQGELSKPQRESIKISGKISTLMKKRLTPRPPKNKIPSSLYQYFAPQVCAQENHTQQMACAP